MTRLSRLRRQLASLARRRKRVRWATGCAALALAVLWLLAGAFLVDWLLELDRPQRVVVLALCAAGLVWTFRRFAWPWLAPAETVLDVALLVERQQHIDSDVVAALQFESPEAPQWGSVLLEQKVIEQTAELGRRLDMRQAVSRRALGRRFLLLAATCVFVAAAVGRFPDHARTFLSRFFLLARRHYPTWTLIESIAVNGRRVEMSGWRPQAVASPYGRPVRLEAICSGYLPAQGRAEMISDHGSKAMVVLDPVDVGGIGNPPDGRRGVYRGELAQLVEPVEYQLYVGDARTDPARLEVVPLPIVELEIEVQPPSYARGEGDPGASPQTIAALRQVSVIEGSRVVLRIRSAKALEKATLLLNGQEHTMDRETLSASLANAGSDRWFLDPANTPLARVVEPIRYEVRAVDVDGLEPERPIQGVIRIKADQRPRIAASAVTQVVLPSAKPRIAYQAWDDYGLAQVSILPEVTRQDGRVETCAEMTVYQLEAKDPRLDAGEAATQGPAGSLKPPASGLRPPPPREVQDQYPLDLAPLRLGKGDRLKVVLQAVDYRGQGHPGKAAQSEPLTFEVTDERGILAAMAEADRESAGRLKDMIQRQIEVGESP